MARGRPYEIKRPRQQAFCRAMAATNDPEYAAWKAGYADPPRTGRKMMTKPVVQREVAEMAMRRLTEEGAPMAVDTILEILPNKLAKPADRLKAASMVLAIVRESQGGATDPGSMTPAQLGQALREAMDTGRLLGITLQNVQAIEAEFEEVTEPAKQGVFD